jgi:hypothetical protein
MSLIDLPNWHFSEVIARENEFRYPKTDVQQYVDHFCS